MDTENKLAIVIPAYKHQFLSQALQSIANQTCKRFTLYIGDDASPHDLKTIVEPYKSEIYIVYNRFENNLGAISLTRQWDRCIKLSRNEEYIWLFSDDDRMPSDAVERFYQYIGLHPECEVFRFNLQLIDETNNTIREASNHPGLESSVDFIKRRLSFSTLSAACEYIFLREAYLKSGGFVEFPLAWCSDDATWSLLALGHGIVTIKGKPVLMRMSNGMNISSDNSMNKTKFNAVLLFIAWIQEKFKTEITDDLFYRYLQSQLNYLSLPFFQRISFFQHLSRICSLSSTISLIMNKSKYYKFNKWYNQQLKNA